VYLHTGLVEQAWASLPVVCNFASAYEIMLLYMSTPLPFPSLSIPVDSNPPWCYHLWCFCSQLCFV